MRMGAITGCRAILLEVFCCALLIAQAPQTAEVISHEAPLTFGSRVNLVSVPVVVRDREGRPVGNLRQDDFQVLDKGKLQVITKFSVEKSGSAAVAAGPSGGTSKEPAQSVSPAAKPVLPDRYVAYLFDDVHLQGADLLQARLAVNRHLDEALEPSSRAAIFTASGQMLADFTDDREKLHKAVNSVQSWTSGSVRQQDCPAMTYYMADLLVNKLLYFDGVLYSDGQLAALIMNGMADRALTAEVAACGMSSNLAQAIGDTRRIAREVLIYGDRETGFALGGIQDVVRRLSLMPGSRTIVLVSPGFLLTRDHRSAEYEDLDRAIRANVTVNTIDIRGLYTTIPGGDASQRGVSGFLAEEQTAAATQADDVLSELADGTGGTFFHNDNGLKEGLNLLAARPEYAYVLGFSPTDLKYDGSYHNLKVTVKNGGTLTLQFRHGYWAQPSNPKEEAKEEIRETVFSRDEIQDIPLNVQTEFFKSGEFTAELTVVSRLELKGLQFRKAEDRNNDTLTVVTGLFNANGILVAGFQKVVEMHLRDQTMESMRNGGIKVTEDFNVAPGNYVVRVVVRDAEGKTMAARNAETEIP
jgi:VWFA-related protein